MVLGGTIKQTEPAMRSEPVSNTSASVSASRSLTRVPALASLQDCLVSELQATEALSSRVALSRDILSQK